MSSKSRQAIESVLRHVSDGQLDEGLRLCQTKLDDDPDDVNLTALLGALLLKKGHSGDAERHLQRAIELEPQFAKPYEDLGSLYLVRDEAARAVTFFESAARLGGPQQSVMKGLAAALHRCGRAEEAKAIHEKYFAASTVPPALAQAQTLRAAGDLRGAEVCCHGILEKDANNIAALRMLALIGIDAERYGVAEDLLRRIVSLVTDKNSALHDLARFLGDRGRYAEAIELLEVVAENAHEYADVQQSLGDMLAIVGRSQDALAAYERRLAMQPDDTSAQLGRAHMLRIHGQSDAAVKSYRQCIAAQPEFGETWWNLSTMRGYVASEDEVALMLRMVAAESVGQEAQVAFRFALGRAYEARDDYERAWQQYEAGNSAKRTLVKYDPVETESQNRAIKDVFNASLISAGNAATPGDVTPVFIVGMPRSGSTLIEQVLASHSSVAGCGELPYVIMLAKTAAAGGAGELQYPDVMSELNDSQLTGLGRSYLHYALSRNTDEKPFFTDKMPANFSHVGFIRQILPHAKIIDARRGPMATCVANFRQLYAQGKNQSYDLTELGEYYLQYVDMMSYWDHVLPAAVLKVQYEDVVADIDAQVRRILDYCGLPFEEACVNFHRSARPVNTASSEQVRQPLYSSSVDSWKHYDPYLDELREILAPVM